MHTLPHLNMPVALIFILLLLAPLAAFADLSASYLSAVEDAKIAQADEICTTLKAITPTEPDLVWEGEPGTSRVLVTSLVSAYPYEHFYKDKVGQEIILPADCNVWVTVVPEMKDFFQTREPLPKTETAVRLRIKQLLGLPHTDHYAGIVEMWVSPERIFRPTPDPEITDHEACLDFPTANNPFLRFAPDALIKEYNPEGPPVTTTFPEWFENLRATTYTAETPYPWTRLGYTYDWNPDSSEIGLSEFIVLGESCVKIRSLTGPGRIRDYFCPPTNAASRRASQQLSLPLRFAETPPSPSGHTHPE